MKELTTPFGIVEIRFDGIPVEYTAIALDKNDRRWPGVQGRYKIVYPYESDGTSHGLSCCVQGIARNVSVGVEAGQDLQALAFLRDDIKMTLGAEGEEAMICGYDYTVSYLDAGLQYNIAAGTKTQSFVFGVSWIFPCGEKGSQPWLAADPSLMDK